MKKLFLSIIFAFTAFMMNAQEIKTLNWGGVDRQYLEYVPESYTGDTPAPVLFFLHGLGDDINNSFSSTNFKQIADEKGWILVYPQALDYTLTLPYGIGSYDFGTAWTAGVTIAVTFTIYGMPLTFNVTLNDGVDDSGFLNSLVDEMGSNYNIDADSVFFAGFSIGGFMCHRMAIEHGERVNGIASISGLIGTDMKNLTPAANVNMLLAFGTNDQVISYDEANITYNDFGPYNVGLPAEQTTEYWRNFNNCNEEAIFEPYPDSQNDGLTFEMYSYLNGDNDARVSFLKVNNGIHTWYSGSNYDVDYETEIYRFFTNTLDVTHVAEQTCETVSVYPNPATDFIQLNFEEDAEVTIYNAMGAKVLQCVSDTKIDVSSLANGIYFIQAGESKAKFVINR